MRRIVILPPHNLWEEWTDPPNPDVPDREEPFRILASAGYRHRRIDPFRLPWNPLARAHPILRAIDPLRALRVMLFHRRTDIVIACFESSALAILLLRRLLFFRGKVVIHDVGIGGTSRLRDTILRLALPRADMTIPSGRAQTSGLYAMGARPGTVRPARLGTFPALFQPGEDRPDGYILAVGDDISRDYPTFLAAVADLPRPVRIRSRVLSEDRAKYPTVAAIAHSLTAKDYKDLIAGAVLVVLPLHPSTHAGGVSTLMETMASGKPLIVSTTEGLADYVEDGLNCLTVPPGDPARLRAAIDGLLASPEERARLGANARQYILDHCSAKADAAHLATIMDELLGQRP